MLSAEKLTIRSSNCGLNHSDFTRSELKNWYFVLLVEIQIKLDIERRDRSSLEERLLEAEKRKNEMSVDMSQLQSQITSLKSDLRNENEKVSTVHIFSGVD